MTVRQKLRSFLKQHPNSNPYRFSFNSSFRYLTNPIRALPDFLIIGGSKSGKWSVLSYLNQHPQVYAGTKNNVGIYFFDSNFEINSIGWYRSHFPLKSSKKIIGEAPGTYLYHPLAPVRIKKVIPNVKLINFFRDPVFRAYSAYNHAVVEGWEHSTFEEAINAEFERMDLVKDDSQMKIENTNYVNYMQFSYIRHGLYAKNIENWFKIFPRNQFLFYSTEQLDSDYQEIMDELFQFFNLQSIPLEKMGHQHVGNFKGKYPPMNSSTKELLINFYKKHNHQLFELIGKKFQWSE